MLVLSGISKPFCQMMFLFIIAVCLAGVTVALPLNPQPIGTDTSAPLPPLHFPKDDYDEEGGHADLSKAVLPPKVFPKITESDTTEEHDDAATSASNTTSNQNDTEKPTAPTSKLTPSGKLASEVPDLLNSDSVNITVYEDGTETPIQNDTVTVTGPNVVNNGKTHEEDGTEASVESKEDETKNDTVHKSVKDEKNDSVTVSPSSNSAESNHEVSLATTPQEEQGTPSESSKVTESTQSNTDTSVTTELQVEKNTTVSQEISEVDTSVTTSSSSSTEGTVVVAEEEKKKKESTSDKKEKKIESTSDSKEKKIKTKSDNRTVKKDEVIKSESTSKELDTSTSKQDHSEAVNVTVQPSLKDEVETVSGVGQNTISHEDIVQDSPMALAAQQHADHSHASNGKTSAFLQPTESAAILAGVFVGIALLGYVGLLVWRRILEKRYGNREMLVNEDDFYDTNDLRNFEL